MTDAKRALAYCRVSTDEQDEGNQLDAIRAAVERDGLVLADRDVFRERVSAWNPKAKRKELDRLTQLIESGDVGGAVLYVFDLSRLTRKGPIDALIYVNRCNVYGVRLKSLGEPWLDPANPMYELHLTFSAWAARELSRSRSAATKAGIKRWVAMGGKAGRQPVPLDLKQLEDMRASGLSFRDIAKRLKVSVGHVHKTLKRKTHPA